MREDLINSLGKLPIVEGRFDTQGIDISNLKNLTNMTTLDLGLKNTSITESNITYLNGDKGELLFRGYPIEQLSSESNFEEICYLLLYGELPSSIELKGFQSKIASYSSLDENIKRLLDAQSASTHPMAILISITSVLEDGQNISGSIDEEDLNEICIKLIAQFKIVVAWIYRKRMDLNLNFSNPSLSYVEDFYQMMFRDPASDFKINQPTLEAIEKLLILHADHEQNCSTFTVRTVGSSQASVHACISAGICALWGKLHGGANQEVIEMIEEIQSNGGDVNSWISRAKDKSNPFKLMGIGHRIYKNYDPRAKIIKQAVENMLSELDKDTEMLKIARSIEEIVLSDPYFIDRKLYPNVDFYSGIIYQALNIPKDMFTVIFALGRLPGWLSHWKEMKMQRQPIVRPGQIYTGKVKRDFIPIEHR